MRPTPAHSVPIPARPATRSADNAGQRAAASAAFVAALCLLALRFAALYAARRGPVTTGDGGLIAALHATWDVVVPFPPSVAAAGIAVGWVLARARRPRGAVSWGGVWGGVILSLGVLVLYMLARLAGMA